MTQVRVGLIGLSWITADPVQPSLAGGRSPQPGTHAAALARIPEATVVAVADLLPAARDQFQAQWGATWPAMRAYDDAFAMIAEAELDVLAVATPDDKHAAFVIAAAERGIPAIMCEKPLATTLADADRMIAATSKAGTLVSVDHTRRWDPFYARVHDLIAAGRIGDVKTVTGTLHGERAMLFRNGTHILDLMGWYAGAPPAQVFARLEPGFDTFTRYAGDGGRDPGQEPGASAYIEYANGVRGFFNGTKGAVSWTEWDILGTAGRLRINPQTAELWTLDPATGELVLRPFPASMVMIGGVEGAYRELFAALRDGGPLRSDAQQARQVVALIEGILASHQAGTMVPVATG